MKPQKLVTLTLRPPMDMSLISYSPQFPVIAPGGGCPAATCNLRSVRADRKIEAATGRLALAIGQAARQKGQLSRKRTGSAGQPSRKLGHSNPEPSRKRTSLRFTGISQAFRVVGRVWTVARRATKTLTKSEKHRNLHHMWAELTPTGVPRQHPLRSL